MVCPRGCASVGWAETRDPFANAVITVRFGRADCAACPARARCTRAARGPRRLTLRPQPQHRALRAARARQGTPEFRVEYAALAGAEGILSQGIRACDLRQARYAGLARTRLQHLLTAAAMNFARLGVWFAEMPRAATRPARLAILAARGQLAAPPA